jgi:DNA-binding protein HU-beta
MVTKKKSATVSTSQLISAVAEKHSELPKKVTKEILQEFLAVIEAEIAGNGRKVRIDKIGILQVKERAARMGRNPQTGEEIKIPASKKVAFRAAKSLKEAVGIAKKTTAVKKAPPKKKK